MRRTLCVILVAALLVACEPMGPLPGRTLSGEVSDPPQDWSGYNDTEVIQLETSGPYSVNIWGVVSGNHYYVASAGGAEARWAQRIERSPDVRLRIEDELFELRAITVTDEDELETVAEAFNDKYDLDAEEDFPEVIVYRLVPRNGD